MNQASTRTVDQWVDYIQTLHFREIELSLERVRKVYLRLYPNRLPFKIITVAGTNGKGSTAAMLSSIYRAAGHRVGKFTSPHLVDFAERYEIDGENVAEDPLLTSLKKIELCRADVPITFFEFGALLAIDLFATAKVDIAIMEVGLGGRLDAINILDADVAIITSISIDHTAWLGNSIEGIAHEKAGIARASKPCIVGIEQPPKAIVTHCENIAAELKILGRDFSFEHSHLSESWSWSSKELSITDLPLPFAQAGVQLSNAATALRAIQALAKELPVEQAAIHQGLAAAAVLARCQVISTNPMVILDVSHNESSVKRLAEFVRSQQPSAKIAAVVGMLFDKEIGPSLEHMSGLVDRWNTVTIQGERGSSAEFIAAQLNPKDESQVRCFDAVEEAFDHAISGLKSDDVLVVFGSFYIAGDILRHIKNIGFLS